jgi:GMP synthase PP-ATPase subunit
LKVQGVAGQVNPVEVLTAAAGGVDSTVKAVVVPRVMVAQADNDAAARTSDAP